MGLTVDSSQLTFLPSSKSRDTKRTNINNPAKASTCYNVPNLKSLSLPTTKIHKEIQNSENRVV